MAGTVRLIQSVSLDEINKALRDIQDELTSKMGVVSQSSGVIFAPQSQRPRNPPKGQLWYCTDYGHLCRWTGNNWDLMDGGGNFITGFAGDPAGSIWDGLSGAWKLVDGTGDDNLNPVGVGNPITYLLSDGSLGKITSLGDIHAGVYLKMFSAYTGTVIAPSGSISINPITPAGTVSTPTITVNNASLANSSNFTTTGATTAIQQVTHNHTASSSTPTFTGTPTTPTGSVSGVEPSHINLKPYYRK